MEHQAIGRTKNVSLNTLWAIVGQGVTVLLGLFSRKVFLDYLGVELLGVNSLFADVLLLFSFAELGIGTAIMYTMYGPIAENDENKVKSILLYYRNLYNIVMLVLIFVSFAFIPFLTTIKTDIPISDLRIYYLLFQLNNILGYVWAYRTSYVIAIQKERLITKINLYFSLLTTIILVSSVIVFQNFLLYLILSLIFAIGCKLCINHIITRKYPITLLKDAKQLNRVEKKTILSKSYALLITKIGNLIINQTDSLVVSVMVNVAQWGLASNYLMIKKSIFTISDKIFSGLLPSMGNLVAENNKKKELDIFLKYDFFNAWLHTFFFVAMGTLSSPFVALFFGEKALLSNSFVLVFFLAAFIDGLRSPISVLREASGTFDKDKWYTILAAIVNLITSIPLAYILGLPGVFVGTICSMSVLHICRSWVLFRDGDYGITTYLYIRRIIVHIVLGGLLFCLMHFILLEMNSFCDNQFLLFGLKILTILILPNILWIMIYHRNKELRLIANIIKSKL